jgi:hypothetical protein
MDPVMTPELRLAWSIIGRIAEKDYRQYATREEVSKGLTEAGFETLYTGEFLFERSFKDWLDSKIKVPENGNHSFEKYIKDTLRGVVLELFPVHFQEELHLDKNTDDLWFAYNCLEMLAVKL